MFCRSIITKFSRAGIRTLHVSAPLKLNAKDVQEVKIPVPWGHVSACWWGSKDVQPVISLHGWLDNAGVWKPLLEVMPDDYSFLAIDFPGEGRSSHLPKFQNYSALENVCIVRRIVNHLGIKNVTLLGHSGGSAISFLYSSLYNSETNGFFGIDLLVLAYKDYAKRTKKIAELIDRKIELGLRDTAKNKVYSVEEAKNSWCEATRGSVSPDSADILMERGVTKVSDDKVIFSRDHRQKTTSSEGISVPEGLALASAIKCHTVLIKAKSSKFFDMGIKECPEILDVIKSNAKTFEFHTLEGRHHIHMDHPDVIAPLLVKFLQKAQGN